MAGILVAGLNPCWQQVFSLPSLRPGEVNRAVASEGLASGKGFNAARVLARRGHRVSLLQILAGVNGERVLEACAPLGIRSLHALAAGETRACATLLHEYRATEIIGAFAVEDPDLPARLLELAAREEYDALLICGGVPEGLDPSVHAELVARVRARRVVWDSVSGLTPGILSRVSWIKVNRAETARLAALREGFPECRLLVTDGPDAALLRAGTRGARLLLPRLDGVVNPIGAGDTATAMLADGLLEGLEDRRAAARAVAAASASCLTMLPGEWDAAIADGIERAMAWEEA